MSRAFRRTAAVLLAGSTVAALAACGGGSSDADVSTGSSGTTLTKVNFVFDWIPTTGDVPVLAAEKFGWFKDAGLDVKTTPGGPSVSASTLVSAGQQDLGIVPPTGVMSARANGAPIISVGLTQPVGPTGLICNPDAGIKADDPSTLNGKKIGFSNNANDSFLMKWMQTNGVDTDSIKQVQSGSDLSMMFAKQADCMPNFLTLWPEQVKEHYGKDAVVFKTASIGAVGQSIVTNESYLASHKTQVQGFLTAYAKGMQWALKNPDEAVKLVKADYPSYDEKQAAIELPALEKFWTNDVDDKKGLLYFDQSTLQSTYDIIKGTKWLSKDIDLSKAFDTSALPSPAILP
jgi:NitT/TauT family transport system substrate-binding protein